MQIERWMDVRGCGTIGLYNKFFYWSFFLVELRKTNCECFWDLTQNGQNVAIPKMSQSRANLVDKWVLIVSELDLLFLIWPRYHVSSQMNSKATGSWMMSHYWVSKITIDLHFLLIPKLLKCESREWLITSWRGVWGWNVEVTLWSNSTLPWVSGQGGLQWEQVCVWWSGRLSYLQGMIIRALKYARPAARWGEEVS